MTGVGTLITVGIGIVATLIDIKWSTSKKEQFQNLKNRIGKKINDGFKEEKKDLLLIF